MPDVSISSTQSLSDRRQQVETLRRQQEAIQHAILDLAAENKEARRKLAQHQADRTAGLVKSTVVLALISPSLVTVGLAHLAVNSARQDFAADLAIGQRQAGIDRAQEQLTEIADELHQADEDLAHALSISTATSNKLVVDGPDMTRMDDPPTPH